jgi:hypothetical protein
MLHRALVLPWIGSLLLQGLLAGVLLWKRMWTRFPIFVTYAVSSFVLGATLYGIFLGLLAELRYFPGFLYSDVYWFNELAGLMLGIGVVYEIFRHLFGSYPALRKLASQCFKGTVVFFVLLGCAMAYLQPMAEHASRTSSFLVLEECARVLEVGLLGFLFLFASVFGLHWRQYAFGIAIGLGVFVAVELVGVTMRLQFGMTANSVFNLVRTFSFNASLLIWIGYILAPELATSPAEMPKRAQLEQWNRAVMELIYQ